MTEITLKQALFSNTDEPEKVLKVISAALQSVDPSKAVSNVIHLQGNILDVGDHTYDLDQVKRISCIGFGKAAYSMSLGLVDVLGERLCGGVLVVKHMPLEAHPCLGMKIYQGSHPVPDVNSVTGSQAVADWVEKCTVDDLVFCLISGGGSALLSLPRPGIALGDIQELTRLLLVCGADINEMNTLRKHVEQLKGGGLVRRVMPARLITLILSDVIGSPLEVIASGPTTPDPSSFENSWEILEKYRLTDKAPGNILNLLECGRRGEIPETLKPGEKGMDRVQNVLVASNRQAAEAALAAAHQEGFNSLLLTTYLHGEAKQAGAFLGSILKEIAATNKPIPRPACLLVGGETTVTIRGNGLGGRNQELALGAVPELAGLERVTLISLATDGEDGPTDAAGAFVNGNTFAQGVSKELQYTQFLENNDSYHYFQNLGGLLKIGPTGTNVNDLAFLFAF